MDDETMSFYDHFSQDEKMPTKIGMRLVQSQNKRILNIFNNLMDGRKFNILEIGPGRGVFAETCTKEEIEYTAVEAN
jgi:16S rRNA A1518/A1519 N6-dimethyltransferase RsmA/KsgA/DIM1 with predicted DNA glycosylase/AP lyase activity